MLFSKLPPFSVTTFATVYTEPPKPLPVVRQALKVVPVMVAEVLPVWLIVVVYKGVKYHVGVNGQTGKVAVNLPIDPGKQGKKTRKSTVSDILMTLSVIAFAIILVFVIGFSSGSFEGVDLLHPNWSALDGGEIAFVAAIAVAFLGMLVLFAAGAYIRAKREVKDSMHNVAEAQDADDFIEEGNLSLSFSGNKKGPRQEQDNWPV